MLITRASNLSGATHTREIAVTPEQLARWKTGGELIQRVMPNLTPDEREFIITGIVQEEWDAAFPEEE